MKKRSNMSYILHIETSTKKCSVALAKDGKLVHSVHISDGSFNHAEKLHLFIEEVLEKSEIKLKDIAAIAISKGPGSYTGLRIGVSTAKGLCYALEIPLLSVSTLETLARQLNVGDNEWIAPMIDARRMEVFTQLFDKDFNAKNAPNALIVDSTAFDAYNNTIHILGDGAEKCMEILQDKRFIFHIENKYPSAEQMIEIAHEKFLRKDFEDVAYFEPYYLKDFMLNK